MSLPKIKDFNDFNHYPSDPQPTTDADMQDYMLNQNDILTALTKRLMLRYRPDYRRSVAATGVL